MNQAEPRLEPLRGLVRAILDSELYQVRLDKGGDVTAHVAPEMRLYNVRLLQGDAVLVAVSPYDPSQGRIVGRAER